MNAEYRTELIGRIAEATVCCDCDVCGPCDSVVEKSRTCESLEKGIANLEAQWGHIFTPLTFFVGHRSLHIHFYADDVKACLKKQAPARRRLEDACRKECGLLANLLEVARIPAA